MLLSHEEFNTVDNLYKDNDKLLNKSGKLKREIKAAAKVRDITFYASPRITGTRFVGHRRKALIVF